jgi:hypothetical protein
MGVGSVGAEFESLFEQPLARTERTLIAKTAFPNSRIDLLFFICSPFILFKCHAFNISRAELK